MPTVKWNDNVKLIISDVDETAADLYVDAELALIKELEKLLEEGRVLFLISGQSVKSIQRRIVNYIKSQFRQQVIVGHCSGVEVWGFDNKGNLRKEPFYSLYANSLTPDQKNEWRKIIQQLIKEFKLKVFPAMPIPDFENISKGELLSIMVEDRGPQITFEVVNGYDLSPEKSKELAITIPKTHGAYDLRIPILERAEHLFAEANLPITPRLAGVFAIDFAVKGVSKTTAVKYIIEHETILSELGLTKEILKNSSQIEVWGDKFSVIRGGTDRHISEALPKEVRSITFREENPEEFPQGYNIIVWDGKKHLHSGLLEFLKSR